MTHPIPLPLPGLDGLDITEQGARPTDLDLIDADQVIDACAFLRRRDDQSRWVLGDLYLALAHAVGDAEANRRIAAQGHPQPILAACASVCAAIPHSVRRPTLTWSHHVEVVKMDRPAQAHWLERAETEAWSVRDLRAAIHADHDDRRPQLPGTERLPRPPESLLRAALAEVGPDGAVLWLPGGGALAGAKVKHVAVTGGVARVVIDVDASMANVLGGPDEARGAA